MQQITVDLMAEDARYLDAIVLHYASGRFGIEISREEAIRIAVRELAERCRPNPAVNECSSYGHESAPHHTSAPSLDDLIEQMDRTPDSNIAMCHAQGKTAVYVSRDRRYVVEHPPHGPITLTPRDAFRAVDTDKEFGT